MESTPPTLPPLKPLESLFHALKKYTGLERGKKEEEDDDDDAGEGTTERVLDDATHEKNSPQPPLVAMHILERWSRLLHLATGVDYAVGDYVDEFGCGDHHHVSIDDVDDEGAKARLYDEVFELQLVIQSKGCSDRRLGCQNARSVDTYTDDRHGSGGGGGGSCGNAQGGMI